MGEREGGRSATPLARERSGSAATEPQRPSGSAGGRSRTSSTTKLRFDDDYAMTRLVKPLMPSQVNSAVKPPSAAYTAHRLMCGTGVSAARNPSLM